MYILPCDTFYIVVSMEPAANGRKVTIYLSKVLLEEGDVLKAADTRILVIGGPFPADGGAQMAEDWVGANCPHGLCGIAGCFSPLVRAKSSLRSEQLRDIPHYVCLVSGFEHVIVMGRSPQQ